MLQSHKKRYESKSSSTLPLCVGCYTLVKSYSRGTDKNIRLRNSLHMFKVVGIMYYSLDSIFGAETTFWGHLGLCFGVRRSLLAPKVSYGFLQSSILLLVERRSMCADTTCTTQKCFRYVCKL